MKNKFELKSALIGLCVGVGAMLAIAATPKSSTLYGRFQIEGTSSHALIIDTATGQAWSAYLPQNGGKTDPAFWKEK